MHDRLELAELISEMSMCRLTEDIECSQVSMAQEISEWSSIALYTQELGVDWTGEHAQADLTKIMWTA